MNDFCDVTTDPNEVPHIHEFLLDIIRVGSSDMGNHTLQKV
jgi:hypothetical protein